MWLGRLMELTIDDTAVKFELYKRQEILGYLNKYYYINVALYVGVNLRK